MCVCYHFSFLSSCVPLTGDASSVLLSFDTAVSSTQWHENWQLITQCSETWAKIFNSVQPDKSMLFSTNHCITCGCTILVSINFLLLSYVLDPSLQCKKTTDLFTFF